MFRLGNCRLNSHGVPKRPWSNMRVCFVPSFHCVLFLLRNVPIRKYPIEIVCRFVAPKKRHVCCFRPVVSSRCFRYGMFRFWHFRSDLHVVSKCPRNDMRSCSAPFFFPLWIIPIRKNSDRICMSSLSAWETTCRCCFILLFRHVFSLRKVSVFFVFVRTFDLPDMKFLFPINIRTRVPSVAYQPWGSLCYPK